MKSIILFASLLSMAVAYKSFLSMDGRELINSGRGGGGGGGGGKVGSSQLLSSAKQASSFKASSISKATRSSVSSFKPSRQTQQVVQTQQVETPVLAPAPTVAEAPQLFAILVPAEEVATNSVAAAPAPKFQLSTPSSAPVVQSKVQSVAPGAHITAAVQTHHTIELVDVPSSGSSSAPPEIHIPASSQPIDLAFHSQSSPITIRQVHIPGKVSPPQHSESEEEPEILRHTVIKPLIQEVTEIVIPTRKITQEIKPVEEVVNQVVTRAQTQNQSVQRGAQITAKPVASAPKISFSSKPSAIASGVPTFAFSSKPVSFASGNQPKIFLAITKVNGNIIKK